MARINIRRIAISLAIGAMCTVVIAWVLPILFRSKVEASLLDPMPWPIALPADWPTQPTNPHFSRSRAMTSIRYERDTLHDQAQRRFILDETRCGWPFRALTRFEGHSTAVGWTHTDVAEWSELSLSVWHSGLSVVAPSRPPSRSFGEPLPIKPLWPGFLANSLFYASIPWLLMFGVSTLKRRRRARRGLCVQCAYPIAGLNLCPECGTATPSTTANGTPASESGVKPHEAPLSPSG